MGFFKFRLLLLGALSAFPWANYAEAVSLGEITLQSRVGEPLRAELPVFVNDGEFVDSNCFSLNPQENSDLPTITSASLRLVNHEMQWRLLIRSKQEINEPLFVIRLRIHCGDPLQRDYVLMPEAPITLAATENNPLTTMENDAPPRARPVLRPRPPPRHPTKSVPASAPQRNQALPRDLLTRLDVKGGDHVLLSAEPAELQPGEQAVAALGSLAETEQRLLKLETSLHSLGMQIENLNAMLAVNTEAAALKNQLAKAQVPSSLAEPGAAIAVTTPIPGANTDSNRNNWLELLLSALIGGIISSVIAHQLSRRQVRASAWNKANP